jgi:methionyl aminopeptidase
MLFRKPKQSRLLLAEPERNLMRRACRFNSQLMDYMRPHVRAGVTTGEIDRLVYEYTIKHGHMPASLGYQNFPKSCCTSVNNVICHGIPGNYVLKEGDIVNVDCTSIVEGWHGDSSETFVIGRGSELAYRVVQCSFDALWAAIDALQPGSSVSAIGDAVVLEAKKYNFSIVREFVGHGLGRKFHQEPSVPHYPTRASRSVRLEPGICFTIEPMINTGDRYTVIDKLDGWTVCTRDGGLSAQFEHTILMTESGPEVLTLSENGLQRGHKFVG